MAFNICLVRWLAMLATTAVLVLQHVAAQDTPAPAASSAADVTTVTVSANAFDDRTDDSGCTPNGCTAENTFDGDLTDNSRWSCSAELVQAAGGAVGEECQILYEFAEVQSVASVSVAFLKGDERTRTLAVNVNGELFEVIESGGITSGLEIFELGAGAGAPDVLTIGLESQGLAADEFLSIIEVELEVVVSVVAQPTGSPLTAAPAAMTATPITAVPVPATEVPATAVPVADVTPDTMSPVAIAIATPIPASASIATPAPGLPSSTSTSARDLEITPSPSASGSAAGIGDSSGSETSPSGTTTDSTAAGSDSSSGGAPDPTPAPTLPLSSGTSARDLEITPTPAAGNVGASTSATSEGGTSTSDVVRTSSTDFSSTGSLCTDCYVDEQCSECISLDEDREDAYYACLDSGELTSVCDVAVLPYCCAAAVSGNDCMANDAFVTFMECMVAAYPDECSFEDMTCPGVIGLEIAGNDSGSDGATAVSWSTNVLNLTVGVLASVLML